MMKITLNGQPKELINISDLSTIVKQFCKDPTPVIAELNGEVIKNSCWESTSLKDGDTIELVHFVGGGTIPDDPLTIAGKAFTNRFMLGTGKFRNKSDVTDSIAASGAQIVTGALIAKIDFQPIVEEREEIL